MQFPHNLLSVRPFFQILWPGRAGPLMRKKEPRERFLFRRPADSLKLKGNQFSVDQYRPITFHQARPLANTMSTLSVTMRKLIL